MEELKLRPLRVSIFSWIFCVSSACFKILFVVPFILSCHQKCIAAVCNLVLGPFWSLSPMIVNKRDIVFIYFFVFCGTKFAFCFKECRWESYFSSRNAVGKTISGNQSLYLKECNWENYFWLSVIFLQGLQLGKLLSVSQITSFKIHAMKHHFQNAFSSLLNLNEVQRWNSHFG